MDLLAANQPEQSRARMRDRLAWTGGLPFLRCSSRALSAKSLPPNAAGAIYGALAANFNIRQVPTANQRQHRHATLAEGIILLIVLVGVLVIAEILRAANRGAFLEYESHAAGEGKRARNE